MKNLLKFSVAIIVVALLSFTYVRTNSIGEYNTLTQIHGQAQVDTALLVDNIQAGYASTITVNSPVKYAIGQTAGYKEGTNGSAGLATLTTGGTVTVATTAITANSRVQCTVQTPGGTVGYISVPASSITPGVSFVINSSNTADRSVVYWEIKQSY